LEKGQIILVFATPTSLEWPGHCQRELTPWLKARQWLFRLLTTKEAAKHGPLCLRD
jgi:hypothetical protein